MTCHYTQAFEEFLLTLTPSQHESLLSACHSGHLETFLLSEGINLRSCDPAALLHLVRRHFSELTDDDLAELSGGEKKTVAIVGTALAGAAIVAGGAALAYGT